MKNEELIKEYPIQDDVWASRRWNKEMTDYVDLSGHEDYEDHKDLKLIKEGYIAEDGHPKKCVCGCTEFKQVNQTYGEGWIEEYSLECKNEDCLKTVGHWAYGNWTV
tara:strand:+ start:475 stop:795 length:321 start_codon:yes stop_codon:yes gene_type:complete